MAYYNSSEHYSYTGLFKINPYLNKTLKLVRIIPCIKFIKLQKENNVKGKSRIKEESSERLTGLNLVISFNFYVGYKQFTCQRSCRT